MRIRKSSGLVMDLRMKEGDGTTAYDSSRYGNDGALTGCKWVERGLEFNGTSDYVNCGNDASLDITDAITISTWVKRNEETFGSHDGIIARSDRQYALKGVIGTKSVSFYVSDAGGYDNTPSSSDLEPYIWYHVVCVYEDSTNMFDVYINGTLDVNDTTAKSIHSSPLENLHIGWGKFSYFFKGSVDDVKIYNYALNPLEIKQQYDATKYKYL